MPCISGMDVSFMLILGVWLPWDMQHQHCIFPAGAPVLNLGIWTVQDSDVFKHVVSDYQQIGD